MRAEALAGLTWLRPKIRNGSPRDRHISSGGRGEDLRLAGWYTEFASATRHPARLGWKSAVENHRRDGGLALPLWPLSRRRRGFILGHVFKYFVRIISCSHRVGSRLLFLSLRAKLRGIVLQQEESGGCSRIVEVPKIGIVGPGALGCALAFSASRAGWSVEFYGRNTEDLALGKLRIDLLESSLEFLKCEPSCGGSQAAEALPSTTSIAIHPVAELPERASRLDWIGICVKAHQSRALIDLLRACGRRPWLLFQNGLEGFEELRRELPESESHGALTRRGAAIVAQGPGWRQLRLGGAGPTLLAPLRGSFEETERLAGALRGLSWEVEAVADWRPALWGKLAVNAAINALTMILEVPNGQLLRNPEAMALADDAAAEAWAVARAQGIEPLGAVLEWRAVAAATAANRSSSLRDREEGRKSEVSAINGAISRLAAELGMATPVNDILSRLALALDASVAAHLSPQPAKERSPLVATGVDTAQQADNGGSMEPRARRMNGEATP